MGVAAWAKANEESAAAGAALLADTAAAKGADAAAAAMLAGGASGLAVAPLALAPETVVAGDAAVSSTLGGATGAASEPKRTVLPWGGSPGRPVCAAGGAIGAAADLGTLLRS